MFGLFKRKSGQEGANQFLDAVRFDTSGYTFQGEPRPGELRVWHTPEGEALGLYFFPIPPDLPADCGSVNELTEFYQRMLGNMGGKLVEGRVVEAGGCQAVQTVLSLPQQPSGRLYVASLTVPFLDFSYVLKCQCAESGVTGLKAALILDGLLADSEPVDVDAAQFQMQDFDPDDSKYDAEFPQEPVARVRRTMAHVIGSLTIAAPIKNLPSFTLPRSTT